MREHDDESAPAGANGSDSPDEPFCRPAAYFLLDPASGRLRFTAAGRRVLGPRFARAGIDLRALKTLAQARAAAAEVAHRELRTLASELKGRDPALDAAMAELPEWGG